jgi:hypothetical protein
MRLNYETFLFEDAIANDQNIMRTNLSKKAKVIIISVGIIFTFIIATTVAYYTAFSQKSLAIDGIQCNTMEHADFHIHAHLDLFINGKSFTVPELIGIKPEDRCLYWLHTHDDSGIIHIESPVKKEFTLGQFFDIWNKKFDNTHLLNYTTNNKSSIMLSVYVNGKKIDNKTDFRDIPLNSHDEIAIVYGSSAYNIPPRYEFPQGL